MTQTKREEFTLSKAVCICMLVTLVTGSTVAAQSPRVGDVGLVAHPPPVAPEVIVRDPDGRVTLLATRLDAPLTIDGALDEPVYQAVRSASDFVQQEPHEGRPATEQTEVWVFFDDRNLYLSARAWDSVPNRIVASEMRRDAINSENDDNFAIVLGTFYDRRNAFYLQTNPLGAVADSYVTNEGQNNRDWNTVWDVKTRRFDQGWTVEMVIPVQVTAVSPAGPAGVGHQFSARRSVQARAVLLGGAPGVVRLARHSKGLLRRHARRARGPGAL